MTIQLYPENIRRFVEEIKTEKQDVPACSRDPVRFEYIDTPFPAEGSLQAFLKYSRNGRKGVEMCSTVF